MGLPESIVRGPPEEILRYYFESRDEKGHPLLELKLLLVGRGKAGKTTLVKQLAGEKPDKNESETHSIAIRELKLACRHGKVRTRAWDFGGQEILHSTHQFFLTERSLYLLVLEPRTGLAQRDAEYWLKLIETQGGASPVIVIMNWSHDRHWRVDEVKLRRKFPFIVCFISTDALAESRAIDRNPAKAPIPILVFVSYAHDDERQLKRLDSILDVLEQHHGLASWRDRRLIGGDEWDEEIRRRLEEMDIFLFIASQTSLVRPYIKDPEW